MSEIIIRHGFLRDSIYNQLNGKSAMENYIEEINKRHSDFNTDYEKAILETIDKNVRSTLDKVLKDVLK